MKVKYFAWVRERIGLAEETVEPPAEVRTVGELMGWLAQRGENLRPRVRNAADDPRRHRPHPCAPRHRDRRRARNRILSADDRRLIPS